MPGRLMLVVVLTGLVMVGVVIQACIQPMAQKYAITGRDGAPMVLIPAWEENKLPAFYMDKFEVTTKLYAAYLRATGRKEPRYWHEVDLVRDRDRPVIGVTWDDAGAYCRYFGKHLPSLGEKIMASGVPLDKRTYPWGNEVPNRTLANYNWGGRDWHGYETLANVDSYEAGKSPYGVYNLSGNVLEYSSEKQGDDYIRVYGGSWADRKEYLVAGGYGILPTDPRFGGSGENFVGFRCVQDAP